MSIGRPAYGRSRDRCGMVRGATTGTGRRTSAGRRLLRSWRMCRTSSWPCTAARRRRPPGRCRRPGCRRTGIHRPDTARCRWIWSACGCPGEGRALVRVGVATQTRGTVRVVGARGAGRTRIPASRWVVVPGADERGLAVLILPAGGPRRARRLAGEHRCAHEARVAQRPREIAPGSGATVGDGHARSRRAGEHAGAAVGARSRARLSNLGGCRARAANDSPAVGSAVSGRAACALALPIGEARERRGQSPGPAPEGASSAAGGAARGLARRDARLEGLRRQVDAGQPQNELAGLGEAWLDAGEFARRGSHAAGAVARKDRIEVVGARGPAAAAAAPPGAAAGQRESERENAR